MHLRVGGGGGGTGWQGWFQGGQVWFQVRTVRDWSTIFLDYLELKGTERL